MVLQFPSDPELDEIYTFGERSWVWNGIGWVLHQEGSGEAPQPFLFYGDPDLSVVSQSVAVDPAEYTEITESCSLLIGLAVDETCAGGTDDQHARHSDGTLTDTTTINVVGHTTASSRLHGAFRFTTVPIPPGATILSAEFSATVNSTSWDTVDCLVMAYAADNPSTVGNPAAYETDGTTAQVPWVGTNIGTGRKNTGNIASVIQEIVDRPGWAADNDVVIWLIAPAATGSDIRFNQATARLNIIMEE